MAPERSEVQWGRTAIPYVIRRSRRRATVSIAIEPSGSVLLTAPPTTPVERLDRVVRTKARWIVERLRRRSDLPPQPAAREFVSGETFLYLGRQYRLRVERGDGGVVLRHGQLVVAAAGPETERRANEVRRALVDWYRRHAQQWLPEIATEWSRRLRIDVADIAVREQQKRWGSCDARGVLRFNWRIIQAPRSCVEYVVAHELVHRTHRGHTSEFWSALGRAMPNYERRRETLRRIGPQLEW